MRRFFGRVGIGAACVLAIGACADSVPVGLGGGGITTPAGQTLYETEYELAFKALAGERAGAL